MTQRAIDMAESAPIHPLQFLLDLVADKKQSIKDRKDAAQACLPYCVTRLASTEVNVKHSLTDESEQALVNRLLAAQNQLVQLGLSVIEADPVNE